MSYHDTGLEVGHLLKRLELERGAVREGFDEVGVESFVDVGLVDDVEGGDGEGEGGGFYAAADDDLGLIYETLMGLFLWRELRVEDFLEDGPFRIVGFDVIASQCARDDISLILCCT